MEIIKTAEGLRVEEHYFKRPERPLQFSGIDDRLRASIWAVINRLVLDTAQVQIASVTALVGEEFFPHKEVASFIRRDIFDQIRFLSHEFHQLEWTEQYRVIQFLLDNHDRIRLLPPSRWITKKELIAEFNNALEREGSGYRLTTNGILLPVTLRAELEAFESALTVTAASRWRLANRALESAGRYLAHGGKPNYRNAIKEALGAVESVLGIETETKPGAGDGKFKNALDETLKRSGIVIEPTLRESMLKLMAFAHEVARHGEVHDKDLPLEDAKCAVIASANFLAWVIPKIK